MESNSEVTETLNDLIMINNDRIAGYEKAYDETKDVENDLRALFKKFASDSRTYVQELSAEVVKFGGEPAEGTMFSGKLYRVWMDIRSTFSTDNRKAVLENSETGEDAAQQAYTAALENENLPADIKELILSQKTALKTSHDMIKKQRDEQREVSNYPLTT